MANNHRVLISTEDVKRRVQEMGAEISRDYAGRELLVVGILKGAFIFMSDLVRELKSPIFIDFMDVSSYGSATESSGVVRIMKDLDQSIAGKHVLIVEDIIDSGLTLSYIKENLQSRQPASVKICAFLDKPSRRRVEMRPDYLGFSIPDEFVVGYGLDFAEKYRELPYVAVIDPGDCHN